MSAPDTGTETAPGVRTPKTGKAGTPDPGSTTELAVAARTGRRGRSRSKMVGIAAPLVPVYANVLAAPVSDPDTIRRLLVEQVTGMVRWRESVLAMTEAGVTDFVEFGGKVLGPMVKRISPDANAISIVSMDDIEALLKAL